MCQVHLTAKSSNKKTGPIMVTTSSAETCPDTCPFKGSGCYADSGPLKLHWNKVSDGERGGCWNDLCVAVRALPEGALWRHNQAGDLPGENTKIDRDLLVDLTRANRGRKGFTYTHKPVLSGEADSGIVGNNREAVQWANEAGFTVNLSGNNPAHADELADLNIGPVTCVLPVDQTANCETPAGRKIVVCPAAVRDGISCAACGLCARQDRPIIGFPAHGTSKKKASAIASA